MAVSFQGVSSRRSPSQSNAVSTTTQRGIAAASSESSATASAPGSPGQYGSVFAASQRTPPSIAFA